MNTDRLFGVASTDPNRMRQAMYSVIVRSQDDPEVQLQAIALSLLLACRALNVDIRRLLTTMERMANDVDSPYASHFKAVEAYAREQLGGHL